MTHVNLFHWKRPHYLNKFNINRLKHWNKPNYQGSSHAQAHRAWCTFSAVATVCYQRIVALKIALKVYSKENKTKHQERSLKQQVGRCSGHTCWPLNFDLFMSKVRLSTDLCFSHWSLHSSPCLRIFTISEFLLHNKLWKSQSEKQDYKTIHCLSFYFKTPVF